MRKIILMIIFAVIIFFMFLVGSYLWFRIYMTVVHDAQRQEQIRLLEKVKSRQNQNTVIKKEDTTQEKIYQFIRMKESTNGQYGLAVTCAKKGLVNEVGWRNKESFCFNSAEDQEISVKQWLTKKITIDGMTIEEALFIYSGGDYSKSNG
jgi:hypothetical protein